MTRPDLDAIRARNLVDWTGNGKEELSGDVAALLAYVAELESRVTYTVGETEWAHRIAVAEQRFVDEYDAHQETRTLLTDLWLKQRKADAEQMREYGISYHGVRKVLAEYDGGDLSLGKVVELFRAAARELAKEDRDAQ